MERGQAEFRFKDGRFVYAETCMGTGFIFEGRSPLSEAATLATCEQALDILHEADRTFSLYKPESPLSRLSRGETSVAQCPPVVEQVWDECEAWEKATDGWFCAFTPEHTFDPSGLVKTWAARRACEFLEAAGITDYMLNAGGDIVLSNLLTGDVNWRVAIHKPVSILAEEAGVLTVLDLGGTPYRSVCTSGTAERGKHIWNPKAGGSSAAEELVQATVVAADLVTADVWATACFAQGPRCLAQLDSLNKANPDAQVHALIVFPDGNLAATEGFLNLIAKGPKAED